MNAQKNSQWLFRFFAAVAIFAMFFSQSVGVVNAQGANPPSKALGQDAQASLDEVLAFYQRDGKVQGIVGVVVELKDQPAVVVYANGKENLQATSLPQDQVDAQLAVMTQTQISMIQQKQADVMKALVKAGVKSTEIFRVQTAYNGIWLRVDSKDLKKIVSVAGVKAIHPIITKELDNTTSVPLIGAPAVWGGFGTIQGAGVKIGIVDTGVDYNHVNFGGSGSYAGQDFTILGEAANAFPNTKVVGGYDLVGDAYDANPNNITYNPIPTPDQDPMDCNGHGSHVAGTAAGYGVKADGSTYIESGLDTYSSLRTLTSNAYTTKFYIGPGVAPKADVYAFRVFGCVGSTDVVTAALDRALDPNQDGNLMDRMDVVNMSLGAPFGTPHDVDAVASDNVTLAGTIVVASAGNSNDVNYITGSPAAANNAISVASTVDAGAVLSAFEVSANAATTPLMPVGTYPASDSTTFGPQSYAVTADLAYFSAGDLGCTPYTAGTFAGKIALINRGTCAFTIKAKNAQDAGAVGVLLANNVNTFPAGMGGTDATITIPAMLTTMNIGTALRTDMATGTVSVLLTTAHRNSFVMTDATIVDTVSSFSSRGPARGGTTLKPDVSAPGDSIFSTASGSGTKGASFNGTSMAAPHIAGVMALLKQIHPTWTVAQLKALVMNTATNDLWNSAAHTANHTPTRVGAGRASVYNAGLSPVIAYSTENPAAVSLSFGEQAILGTQTFTKSITVKNTDVLDAQYLVSFDESYTANPGFTYTILDSSNVGLDHPITVPAGGSVEVKLQITANALLLEKSLDPTLATGARQRFGEGGGYVTFTSYFGGTNGAVGIHPNLRVPAHIAARPASDMSVAEAGINLPTAATGTFTLTPTGTAVDTADDTSLVSIVEWLGTSPNDPTITDEAGDIQYVGASSNYPTTTFATSSAFFGVSTFGEWDTPNAVEFDIYIDNNEDGTFDKVIFNYSLGALGGTYDDSIVVGYCNLPAWNACNATKYANGWSGGLNTNIFNSNVMLLPVSLSSIGLVDGVNTDFDFFVTSWTTDSGSLDETGVMHFDVANQSFSTVNTVDSFLLNSTQQWDAAVYSPTFDLGYNKANIALNHSKGLLLLHHHNASSNSAEVVPVLDRDTVGVFRPTNGNMYLKNTNTTGIADLAFNYGLSGDKPVSGDWNGDGIDTVGVYRNGVFYLGNNNANGSLDYIAFFGQAGDLPVVGDWDGNGTDTIGVYRNGTFYLRNSNDTGVVDITFALGLPGDVPISGDWDGDGTDTTGVFRPSNGKIFLKYLNTSGIADLALTYGLPGDKPVTGDWDSDGIDSIGVYRNGKFYLRNSNTNGFADYVFSLGTNGDLPIAGNWDGLP